LVPPIIFVNRVPGIIPKLAGTFTSRVVNEHSTFLVNFTMSEGTSEASAAKKRKLGQRILY
jgi:hypothetical protein